jgi:transposase InsO family protein
MRFAFIDAEKAHHAVRTLCRVLEVSSSGYYAYLRREPSQRQQDDDALKVHIAVIHERSQGTYGSPRIYRRLRQKDFEVGRDRVARLMRELQRCGTPKRRYRCTTDSDHDAPVAPNLLQRDFDAKRPNQRWVTDITYVWTQQSWMYLAVVMDLFSRRVVGWAMRPHLQTELALEALRMALGRRMPEPGLVHHSDRGVQYAAHAYQNVLHQHGIVCSMSRKADCWDNAVVESFFARLKTELLHRQSWRTGREVQDAVARYIEGWYNPHRLHSSLGYLSPNQFEQRYFLNQAQAA